MLMTVRFEVVFEIEQLWGWLCSGETQWPHRIGFSSYNLHENFVTG